MYVYIFGMEFCYVGKQAVFRQNRNRRRVICPAPESERCFRLLSDSAVARYDCSFKSTFHQMLVLSSLSKRGVAIYAQHDRDNRIDCL